MNKKEICESRDPIAIYSFGYTGIYIHDIIVEDFNTYVYVSEPGEISHYHRCKVKDSDDDRSYFTLFKHKIYLDECLRTNI